MAKAAGLCIAVLWGDLSLEGATLFPDPNLSQAIASALGKSPTSLVASDLTNLACLSANNLEITNLSGLELATNLTGLYLNGNNIQDLTPLRSLLHLSSLELDQNQVPDLGPLAGLTNLGCLSIGGNPATNYWILSNLTQVVQLYVRGGNFRDLTPLRKLSALESLVLWQNNLVDPSPLTNLATLKRLDLRGNSVNTPTALSALPTNLLSLCLSSNGLTNAPSSQRFGTLTHLDLEDNGIKDVSPLTNLTKLTYLALNRNPGANFPVLTNLTGLVNLELRGNSISNAVFVSSLPKLTYLDLAYNGIRDISALSNISSLVLAGNPVTNISPLLNMTQTTNLWLFGDSLPNASLLTNLTWLNYLNLEQAGLTNLSMIAGLTNLTGLALSGNPSASFANLGVLPRLTSLRLEKNLLVDCSMATNFPSLSFLSLNQNQLSDLSPLAGLTNLHNLYLSRNRLHNLDPLLLLPGLANVDLSLNLTNLTVETNALAMIRILRSTFSGIPDCGCAVNTNANSAAQCERVKVNYLPPSQPPSLYARQRWFVPCNSTSTLPVQVYEYPTPETPLSVFATSANPALVAVLSTPLSGTHADRNLSVLTGCNGADNTTTITLIASDEINVSNSLTIQVTAIPEVNVAGLCPNTDPGFLNAIAAAVGKPATNLTSVDLLSLTDLNLVAGVSVSTPCVWSWMTNLASLYLAGSTISNLDFVTNLTQLTSAGLDATLVTNVAALTSSPNLKSLQIAFSPGTDVYPLVSGLSNLTSLDLTGDLLTNVDFLTNSWRLTSLTLDDNHIFDLAPAAGLTNLLSMSLQQNLVTNLVPIAALTNLVSVDLRLNLLDLADNSAPILVISNLERYNVSVQRLPQRTGPVISGPSQWFIPANATSTLPVTVADNAIYGTHMKIGATSSNSGLLPNSNLALTEGTNGTWWLTARPINGQLGSTMLTLTATNDAGLSTNTSFLVTAIVSQPVSIPDPNLQAAILAWLRNHAGNLSTVDMLDLEGLDVRGAGVSSLAGLGTATNLTSLILDNNNVTDLSPLSGLAKLALLSASNNLIGNISPIQGLTKLGSLNLAQNPITNYPVFLVGFNGLTNLDLSGNGLSNVYFLTNLSHLVELTLSSEQISDGSPLGSLRNLTGLWLAGNLLTNVSFLTNLTALTTLDLSTNRLREITPISALTHLRELDLQQNRITNISPLNPSTGFADVDVSLNELDLSANSPGLNVLNALYNAGASVEYLPQFPLDSDGDGIPDDWELAHGLNPNNPADASLDSDGDGVLNLVEYALGSDPKNPGDGRSGVIVSQVSDGVSLYLSMRYRHRITPVRAQYVPEASGDGVHWFSDAAHVQPIAVTGIDSLFEWVTVINLTPVKGSTTAALRLRMLLK